MSQPMNPDMERCFGTTDKDKTDLIFIAFFVIPGNDNLSTEIREVQKEDPKNVPGKYQQSCFSIGLSIQPCTPNIDLSHEERVITPEYNDMVNLKYLTYLIRDEAEALLDRIEEGAIMKQHSAFTIGT